MLYQQLRPQTLDEIVGNKPLVESLRTLLAKEERPHVFLFSGPSGCGKTTIARIIGNTLGCDMMSLVEINAAQARGIDTIRAIEKTSVLIPLGGRPRLVILDEAHALTTPAQQCLLKVLEDVPEHQYFALCSTDPDKIIATIRNRCATYTLKALRPPDMKELLGATVEKLRVDIEPEVLDMIRIAAEGSPRRALMMLEQVMDMDAEEALDALESGTVAQKGVKELCQALVPQVGGSPRDALKILKGMNDEPESTRRAILGYMSAVVTNAKGAKVVAAYNVLHVFVGADTFRSGKAALVDAVMQLVVNSEKLP